jgi:hypothetical protein
LGPSAARKREKKFRSESRIYNDAVQEALILVREAADFSFLTADADSSMSRGVLFDLGVVYHSQCIHRTREPQKP